MGEVVLFSALGEHNLIVQNLPLGAEHDELFEIFASFGLIFELQIKESERFSNYAFVKYYLAVDAAAAQSAPIIVRGKELKIHVARRSSTNRIANRYFPLYRCIELSNYLWGCSGWSSRVVELKSILAAETVTVFCKVELSVSGLTVYGLARVDDIASQPDQASNHNIISSIGTLKKRAISEATVNAFQRVAVLVRSDRSIQTISIIPNSEMPADQCAVLFDA